MDIQAEKSKLIEWLSNLTDQAIVEKLKLFKDNFSTTSDWWETISENERKSIDRGLSDIAQGRTLPHSEVMKKHGRSV